MSETWKPVKGHKGYEASSEGRVRSVPRTLRDGRKAGGVVLTATPDRDGYLVVTMGRRKVRVNVAVLLAFQGPPEGCHGNGDRQDNRPGNLYWGSRWENERDKRRGEEGEEREEKEGEKDWIGGECSRPIRDIAKPITAVTNALKLSDAVRMGIVSCTLGAIRKARWGDPSFPDPVGEDGLAHLYDPQALTAWDMARRGGRVRA